MTRPGVSWRLAVPPEVITEYSDTRLGSFYSDAAVAVIGQQRAREAFLTQYDVDLGPPHLPVPAYVGVASLGAKLLLPDDDPPMLAKLGSTLTDRASVMELRPADPAQSQWLQRYENMRKEMGRILGEVPALGTGQEGPITSAGLLRGHDFFADVVADPEAAHHLLDVVTDTFIAFTRYVRTINGRPPPSSVGIADDMAGMLSPAQWPEFVLPYWERIYRELGAQRRTVHTELLHPAHLPFLRQIGMDSYDPGNDQYLTVHDVVDLTQDMTVTWNLYTVRDMLEGTAESVTRTYTEAVEAGMTHMMAEICRRTPPEAISAFVACGRAFEGST